MHSAQISAARPSPRTAPTSEWTTLINLRSYHYVAAGPGDAPALLYLHGYADSWRGAERFMPHLQDRFRIYALDQRGHGESDRDFDRFSVDDFVRDAVDFIEHTIERPVTLVGHCMGGLVAQHLAATNPDLVDRLVLIGTASNAHRNPTFDASNATSSAVIRKVGDALTGDARSVSHRIASPTLVLWGERDPVFDRVSQLRLSSTLRQVKSVDYPEVGHTPNREVPAEVARDILSFCMQ